VCVCVCVCLEASRPSLSAEGFSHVKPRRFVVSPPARKSLLTEEEGREGGREGRKGGEGGRGGRNGETEGRRVGGSEGAYVST
jgi:hypothetical protein